MGKVISDPKSAGLERVDMKVWTAVFVVFSFVCSGGFGIEDMVSGAGPGFALLVLLILPFVWGLPQALVCAELGSALPEDGGLYRWSRRANGEFMGFQTGWWWMLSIVVDSAVFIALTSDYMQNWFGFNDWVRWGIAVVLIAILACINIRGLQLAAWVLVIMQILVVIPFAALAVIGIAHWHHNPFSPMLLSGNSLIGGVGVALSVGIWMYSGFESFSTMAGEVKRPQYVIPRALMITLPIVLCFYVLSTMGGLAGVGQFSRWATKGSTALDFMGVGREVGGQVLRYLFFAAMLAGNFALFLAFLAAGARPAFVLSRDKLFPTFLGKTHTQYGTPHAAIILMAAVDCLLVGWGFATLIVIDVFLLLLAHITIFISAVRLRVKEPELKRPFKVPVGTVGLALISAVPICVAIAAMFGNGRDDLIGGTIAALTGPPAYFIFKKIYGGKQALAAEATAMTRPAVD
jgi:amino acid transporter